MVTAGGQHGRPSGVLRCRQLAPSAPHQSIPQRYFRSRRRRDGLRKTSTFIIWSRARWMHSHSRRACILDVKPKVCARMAARVCVVCCTHIFGSRRRKVVTFATRRAAHNFRNMSKRVRTQQTPAVNGKPESPWTLLETKRFLLELLDGLTQ